MESSSSWPAKQLFLDVWEELVGHLAQGLQKMLISMRRACPILGWNIPDPSKI